LATRSQTVIEPPASTFRLDLKRLYAGAQPDPLLAFEDLLGRTDPLQLPPSLTTTAALQPSPLRRATTAITAFSSIHRFVSHRLQSAVSAI